ncbi:hypothetical protein GPECTOR_56g439 [Gonium pectorale]|uniref:Serine aminopeptidase S33 domain-containing protein n=1 Tax=Gonium pectorale TaxID=33097 RepID=A0A150G667_GONPE|nr:hypothetical protein GPECTOR_56g439 [Gonium pectorale]|eukprot:KXZ45342.1 hypothetical protein GPECTOR_56g439 [Gonium pectorale]
MLMANRIAAVSGVFINKRGQRLHTLRYAPPAGWSPGALLILHHGLAEHCGRYDKVCRLLAENGVEVFAYDAHGHGKSEPQDPASRAHISSYTHLVDDLSGVMDALLAGFEGPGAAPASDPEPEVSAPAGSMAALKQQKQGGSQRRRRPPVFLLGHSMGGLVTALLCLKRQDEVAGLMLHSPALDVEWTPLLRVQAMVGGLLATLVPHARVVPAVRPEDMSQDPKVVAEYVTDPLNTVGNLQARSANELLRGMAELQRAAPELRLPVYVCHGSRDACTSAAASRRFVEGPGGVSSVDRVFRGVEGGYHELLHGPEWEDCARELLEWMRGRAASVGGGAAEVGVPAGGGAGAGVPGRGGTRSKL